MPAMHSSVSMSRHTSERSALNTAKAVRRAMLIHVQMHHILYEDGESEWVCLPKEAHAWVPGLHSAPYPAGLPPGKRQASLHIVLHDARLSAPVCPRIHLHQTGLKRSGLVACMHARLVHTLSGLCPIP